MFWVDCEFDDGLYLHVALAESQLWCGEKMGERSTGSCLFRQPHGAGTIYNNLVFLSTCSLFNVEKGNGFYHIREKWI